MRILLRSAAVLALLLTTPGISHAQDGEDAEIVKMAGEHLRLGNDAFKAGDFPKAVKELKKSYTLKRSQPGVLVKIAQTYEKLNDLDNAIFYYKKYLAEATGDAKEKRAVTEALKDVQARKDAPPEELEVAQSAGAQEKEKVAAAAKADEGEQAGPPAPPRAPTPPPKAAEPPPAVVKEVAAAPVKPEPKVVEAPPAKGAKGAKAAVVAAAPVEEPPPPPPVVVQKAPVEPKRAAASMSAASEWAHTAIDAAPPGLPVDVRVQTPVMKGVKVFLYYREQGSADFTPVLMKRHGPEKIGRIPADAMSGKSIQYYIEAQDKTGVVRNSSGTQVDPNIVMIEAGAPAQVLAADGRSDGEDPTSGGDEETRPAPRKKVVAKQAGNEDETALGDDTEKKPKRQAPKKVSVVPKAKSNEPSGPVFSKLGWIGLGLVGGGLLVGGIVGGVGFSLAAKDSALVQQDGGGGPSPAGTIGTYGANCGKSKTEACFYFDEPPSAGGNGAPASYRPAYDAGLTDIVYQKNGHTMDAIGIAGVSLGGALVLTGAALMIVDGYRMSHPAAPPKKSSAKKPAPAKRPVAAEKQSSIQHLMISPIFSRTTVGVGAGFNF